MGTFYLLKTNPEYFRVGIRGSFFCCHRIDFVLPAKLCFENTNQHKILKSKTLQILCWFLFIRDHDQIRTDTSCDTTPSRWRVYQFLHVAGNKKSHSAGERLLFCNMD